MPSTILCFGYDCHAVSSRLRPLFPDVEWRVADTPSPEDLTSADAIIGYGPQFCEAMFEHALKVRWIQSLTTGVDTIVACRNLPKDVVITSTRGVHGPQMSELTFLLMLALTRRFPAMLRNQQAKVWDRWPQALLESKVATIVGLGAIAEMLAPRCKAFGMEVHAVTNSPREIAGVDRFFLRSQLEAAAGLSDYLIVIVPYSADTDKLISRSVIAAMKPSAYLINVARGGVVDEEALVEALSSRAIAGAGLDVFQVEPLPADSPLWSMDNVILTPKIGGASDVYLDQTLPIVRRNIAAFLEGRPETFVNRIDQEPGSGVIAAAALDFP